MQNQKGFTVIELIICVAIIVSIVGGCALVYVAGHFIAKFW